MLQNIILFNSLNEGAVIFFLEKNCKRQHFTSSLNTHEAADHSLVIFCDVSRVTFGLPLPFSLFNLNIIIFNGVVRSKKHKSNITRS